MLNCLKFRKANSNSEIFPTLKLMQNFVSTESKLLKLIENNLKLIVYMYAHVCTQTQGTLE